MPQIEVEIEVWCASCRKGLCNLTEVDTKRSVPQFHVEACPRCLQVAEEDGYQRGYEAGREAAQETDDE